MSSTRAAGVEKDARELSWELFKLFRRLNQRGVTVLIASHDLALVRRMRQRVLVLSDGRLVDDISPESAA